MQANISKIPAGTIKTKRAEIGVSGSFIKGKSKGNAQTLINTIINIPVEIAFAEPLAITFKFASSIYQLYY